MGVIKGDTRSLDYSSYTHPELVLQLQVPNTLDPYITRSF